MIYLYRPKQPGDNLCMHVPISDIEPDPYVLLSIGDTGCLALLAGRERTGAVVRYQIFVRCFVYSCYAALSAT